MMEIATKELNMRAIESFRCIACGSSLQAGKVESTDDNGDIAEGENL